MKKNFKLFTLVALVLAALIVTLGVTALAEGEGEEGGVYVISQNVSYSDKLCLYYAVWANGVSTEGLKLEVYDSDPTENASATLLATVTESTPVTLTGSDGTEYECLAFATPGVALKNMANRAYVRAATADGTVSAVRRYSVVEYLKEMALSSTDENKVAAYEKLLAAGDAAQLLLGYYPDGEDGVPTNYSYVSVEAGAFSDGYDRGAYLNGTELTVTYSGSDEAVVGWTATNLESGEASYLAGKTATFTLSSDLVLAPNTLGYVFNMGQGVYYNDASVTTAARYDFTSSMISISGKITRELVDGTFVAKKQLDETTGSAYASEATVYCGDNAVADSVYEAMTNPALIFETDIKFEGFDNEYKGNIMVRFNGLGYQNRFYMSTDGSYVTYSGTNLKLEIGKWNNLRFEFYEVSEGAFAVKVYQNGVYVGTKTPTTEAAGSPSFRARIYMTKDALAYPSEIHLDNLFYGYVDKAYVAGQ